MKTKSFTLTSLFKNKGYDPCTHFHTSLPFNQCALRQVRKGWSGLFSEVQHCSPRGRQSKLFSDDRNILKGFFPPILRALDVRLGTHLVLTLTCFNSASSVVILIFWNRPQEANKNRLKKKKWRGRERENEDVKAGSWKMLVRGCTWKMCDFVG